MDRLEQREFAGIAEPPVRRGYRVDVDVVGVAFEQRDLVAVLDELPGDGPTDGAAPAMATFIYASLSSAGGRAAIANASAMCPETAAT
jgi:hypothetical protein